MQSVWNNQMWNQLSLHQRIGNKKRIDAINSLIYCGLHSKHFNFGGLQLVDDFVPSIRDVWKSTFL